MARTKLQSVIGFRPDAKDARLLEQMQKRTGLKASDLIRIAIRKLAEQKEITLKSA